MVKLPRTEAHDARNTCSNTKHHDHKMEELGVGLGEKSNNQQGEASAQSSTKTSRRLYVQRTMQSLVHACQCRNAYCFLPSCQKMKRVVLHTKGCRRKSKGGCPVCRDFIALCCSHAKHCQENNCQAPYCLRIRRRFDINSGSTSSS